MATLEELQQQLAAFQAKVNAITEPPDDYYTSRYSGEELDNIADRAKPGGYYDKWVSQLPGQNLLDNSVFIDGCLVDQRNGYVVKPNSFIYGDTTLSSPLNTTDAYKKVEYVNSTYCILYIGEAAYYVSTSDCVRGYMGAGYGIDRLKSRFDSVLLITDNGINLKKGNSDYGLFSFILDGKTYALGKTVTISVLTTEGMFSASGVLRETTSGWIIVYASSGSYVRAQFEGENLVVDIIVLSDSDPDVIAIALDPGDHQKHFYQDADGNWQLNALPNYADTLARCQRYRFKPSIAFAGPSCMVAVSSNEIRGSAVFPVQMRSAPSISNVRLRRNSNGEILKPTGYAIGMGGGNDGFNTLYYMTGVSLITGEYYTVDYEAIADL